MPTDAGWVPCPRLRGHDECHRLIDNNFGEATLVPHLITYCRLEFIAKPQAVYRMPENTLGKLFTIPAAVFRPPTALL